jgi:hypothetical protein
VAQFATVRANMCTNVHATVQLVDADSLSQDTCTGCRVETLVLGVESRHLYLMSSRDTCTRSQVETLVLGVNLRMCVRMCVQR